MKGLIEGRIVHYINSIGWHEPVLIYKVVNKEEGVANLFRFNHDQFNSVLFSKKYSEDKEKDTWHWIEKEE